jgi:nucleotide-binding universal stress UspA family protein
MCAGQGRDIVGVLARHHRAGDVAARLAEEAFDLSDDTLMAVGSHRLTGETAPFLAGQYLFRFG